MKAARDSIVQGLALLGVTGEIEITALMPELERLRAAEAAYAAALKDAVTALALRQTSLSDITTATGVPASQARAMLAEPMTALDDADNQ